MKRSLPIIAMAIAGLMISSCNHNASKDARVKQAITATGATTSYFYGPDGVVSYTQNTDGSKTTYKANGSTITQTMEDPARNIFITSTLYLNKQGIVDSSIAEDQSGHYLKTFQHDADGYIILSKDIVSGNINDIANSVVKDGNEVSTSISDSTGKKLFTVYFDYYMDKTNSLGYEDFGLKFLGKDSKNLLHKFTQVLATGDTFRVNSFNYHYDDQGRVTAKIMYDKNASMKDSTTYVYYAKNESQAGTAAKK